MRASPWVHGPACPTAPPSPAKTARTAPLRPTSAESLFLRGSDQPLLEELYDHPEREIALELRRAAERNAEPALGRTVAAHLQQRALAQPCGSLEHHELPSAAATSSSAVSSSQTSSSRSSSCCRLLLARGGRGGPSSLAGHWRLTPGSGEDADPLPANSSMTYLTACCEIDCTSGSGRGQPQDLLILLAENHPYARLRQSALLPLWGPNPARPRSATKRARQHRFPRPPTNTIVVARLADDSLSLGGVRSETSFWRLCEVALRP